MDHSTQATFEDRFSGLGVFIGSHFHHPEPILITPFKNEAFFPRYWALYSLNLRNEK